MVLPFLCLVGLVEGRASAGFFVQDQYEPPSPHFGTTSFTAGLLVGGYGNPTLDQEPIGGPSWNLIGGGFVLVLPATKLGLRAGAGTYGARKSDGEGTPFIGFRQQALWTDAIVQFESPYLCLYGGPSLLALSRIKAPVWALNENAITGSWSRERNKTPGVAADYRHVALGVEARLLESAKHADGEPANGLGLKFEVRRVWMEARAASDALPHDAAGWLVLGTIAIETRANKSKHEGSK